MGVAVAADVRERKTCSSSFSFLAREKPGFPMDPGFFSFAAIVPRRRICGDAL
jgi:hypothetical protein